MEINLCGDCGWLGSSVELMAHSGLAEIKPELKVIIETNNLTNKCCPLCKSLLIFYKHVADVSTVHSLPQGVSIPSVWLPSSQELQSRQLAAGTDMGNKNLDDAVQQSDGVIQAQSEIVEEESMVDEVMVTDILSQASSAEDKFRLAKDLADGLNDKSKQIIADVAEVPKEELKDTVKQKSLKKEKQKRPRIVGKFTCDDCGKRFESAVKQGKCPDCNRAFLKHHVG